MKTSVLIEARNLTRRAAPLETVRRAVAETLKLLGKRDFGPISVALAGGKRMRSLNKSWRGKDAVTDVISFGFAESGRLPGEAAGEIIICLPYAAKQAAALGIGLEVNLALLAAHGAIHLCGIDHERSKKERRKTEEAQERVLGILKIQNSKGKSQNCKSKSKTM